MAKKTFMLNGKMVDEYGEEIKSNKVESILNSNNQETKKTGAKLANRIIAIALVVTALSAYNIASKAEDYRIKFEETKPSYEEVIADRVVIPQTYQFLYTDTGEKYVIDDLTIAEKLDKCTSCKVGDTYYSRDAEEVVVIKVTKQYITEVHPTESTIYVAPEGYILVGNKCYKEESVIDAMFKEESDGSKTYYAPEGYILYGNKAVKTSDFGEAVPPETKTVYTAPTGYVLQGNKAVKTTQYSTEYILTKEQYENKEYEQLIGKIDDYINHTITTVKAEPMTDLYAELGIEYETPKKLTK